MTTPFGDSDESDVNWGEDVIAGFKTHHPYEPSLKYANEVQGSSTRHFSAHSALEAVFDELRLSGKAKTPTNGR